MAAAILSLAKPQNDSPAIPERMQLMIAPRCSLILWLVVLCPTVSLRAQESATARNVDVPSLLGANTVEYKVRPGKQRLDLQVNGSKILVLPGKTIPRVLVNNPSLVNAIALSASKVQLGAVKAGVTQLNLWDEEGQLYTVDLVISGDSKELELLLESEFPNSSLRVRPLATSIVLSGWVDSPEDISRIVKMAEDYYPKVINNIRVGDNQQVMLHVQVMEISRTKLREMGVDWAAFGMDGFAAQSVSQLIQETTSNSGSVLGTGLSTLTFGVTNGSSDFFGIIDAMRQLDLVKVLAEPTLTTVSGRPAAFNAGGEFPILIPQGLGTVAVEYKQFGTRVDFVPVVLGNGNIRLEVRPQVSEIDSARGVDISGTRVPGLRNRWVDTAVEMRAGQTLALAGLIQERVEAQNRGLPVLADLPWAGTLFRRVVHNRNEIELLVMVRPELVDAMDPEQVPLFGPGENSCPPNDHDLYLRGFLEVPNCGCGDCTICRAGRGEFTSPTPMLMSETQIGELPPVRNFDGALMNVPPVSLQPLGNRGMMLPTPAIQPEMPLTAPSVTTPQLAPIISTKNASHVPQLRSK